MKNLCLLAILSFFLSTQIKAEEGSTSDPYAFSGGQWTQGLHLMAGLGANTAYFESPGVNKEAGIGLNIETNVSYSFLNDYALELSTNVMFNRVKRLLIWNTLGTIGVRFRIPTLLAPPDSYPYVRLAAGRGPTVFIFKGQKPDSLEVGGDRTQIEGDIVSVAYGFFQNARDGMTWFLEFGATVNSYRK
ncbi:MAG: hypothetical protein EOP07_23130, partial [Proteobacteria bacterium]